MAAIVVFDEIIANLGAAKIAFGSDTHKLTICTDAPSEAGDTTIADATQISATGGYAAATLAGVTYAETAGGSGIWMFDATDRTFTASGANFDAGRYLRLYDDTPTSPADPLICDWDYGTNFTLTDGNTFTAVFNASGILRIS